MTERLHFHFSLSYIGEGNDKPLQCSCLENPMDGGAWWAAVHGVAQSGTRLSDFTFTSHFNALQKEIATHPCSCLENARDGEAWWAAVYGVAQSRPRLKRLSSSSSSSVKHHGNRPELKGRSQAKLSDSLVNACILPSPVTSYTFLGVDP